MHWCIVSIAGAAIVAVILRFLVRRIASAGFIVTHVDEFVGNLCSGVAIMELGVISSMYGPYSIPLCTAGFVHLFFKNSYFMANDLFASPLTFIQRYYEAGRTRTFHLCYMITITITSGAGLYCGQIFVTFIWAFEDHSHIDALHAACNTAMSSVHPWTYAALAEGFAVLVGTCVEFITPQKLKEAGSAFVTMVLYVLLTHISGMYMNPVIATSFDFRCKGHRSDWQHFLVYWVTPFIATVVGWEFWLAANKFMKKTKVPGKAE